VTTLAPSAKARLCAVCLADLDALGKSADAQVCSGRCRAERSRLKKPLPLQGWAEADAPEKRTAARTSRQRAVLSSRARKLGKALSDEWKTAAELAEATWSSTAFHNLAREALDELTDAGLAEAGHRAVGRHERVRVWRKSAPAVSPPADTGPTLYRLRSVGLLGWPHGDERFDDVSIDWCVVGRVHDFVAAELVSGKVDRQTAADLPLIFGELFTPDEAEQLARWLAARGIRVACERIRFPVPAAEVGVGVLGRDGGYQVVQVRTPMPFAVMAGYELPPGAKP
jgi:hypothetical protein